jgi:hypothetical protein
MGLSALGFDTKAVVQGCVITNNAEHGIAQGQGAEVRVTANTVKDNKDHDIFGNVHDFSAGNHTTTPVPGASHPPSATKDPAAKMLKSSEQTPLIGGSAKSAPSCLRRRVLSKAILVLLFGAILLVGAYAMFYYERLEGRSASVLPHASAPLPLHGSARRIQPRGRSH